MASRVYSATIIGLDAQVIEIEVESNYGLPCFEIVGLPDKAIQESRERVEMAIKNTNLLPPRHQARKVLVNLAPADLKKEGSFFDLPIALGFLLASKQIKFNPENKIFLGELSFDGRLRPIKGAISVAILAQEKFSEIILPKDNAIEASLVSTINNKKGKLKVVGVETLKEVIDYLENKIEISHIEAKIENYFEKNNYSFNLGIIKGQEYAKRALEIAAAGNHNLLMSGPPGTGKTLLAKSLPSLLPPLSLEETLEVTKIYSVAGFLPKENFLINTRPFRSPHHTTSEIALIGGGNPPRPGEITLAHRGILFLDEFPEFHRDALESLRQPIEEGKITILRSKHHLTLPARFSLVAATNPCPCGYFNNPEKNCTCTNSQIQMYKRKLSGPLIDRIDLFIEVPQLKYDKLTSPDEENLTYKIKERIEKTRKIQTIRFQKDSYSKTLVNSEMEIPQIKKYCQTDLKSQNFLKKFVDSGKLSARGYHRTLKIARTIADLGNSNNILYDHVSEALMYRIREN